MNINNIFYDLIFLTNFMTSQYKLLLGNPCEEIFSLDVHRINNGALLNAIIRLNLKFN